MSSDVSERAVSQCRCRCVKSAAPRPFVKKYLHDAKTYIEVLSATLVRTKSQSRTDERATKASCDDHANS